MHSLLLVLALADAASLITDLETFKQGKQSARPDVRALVEMGQAAVEPLIAALENPKARHLAALALGRIRDKAATPRLVKCVLRDPDEAFVNACSLALQTILDPAATPELLAFAQKPKGTPANIREAITVLGSLHVKEASPWAIKQAKHKSNYVRGAVAEALGNMGDPASGPTVIALMKDKDDVVQQFAEIAAGKLKLAAVKPQLLASFNTPHARAAAEALGHMGDIEPLLAALQGTAWQQKESSLIGLAVSGDDKALAAVTTYLDDPKATGDGVICAARGFLVTKDKRGIEPLKKASAALRKRGKAYNSAADVVDDIIEQL